MLKPWGLCVSLYSRRGSCGIMGIMSLKYNIIEGFVRFWNKVSRDGVKRRIYEHLEKPPVVQEIPSYLYKKFNVSKIELGNDLLFVIGPRKNPCDKAVLYIAGGGGRAKPGKRHFKLVSRLVKQGGLTVYLGFYPCAPDVNVRFSLRWLQKVYAEMLKDFPSKKTVFAGDSAGANLALSLCNRVVSKPAKVIAVSPAIGFAHGEVRKPLEAAEKSDPLISMKTLDLVLDSWCKNVSLDSPDVEPVNINYEGYPPVQLFYGTKDMFFPHMDALIANIEAGGAKLEMHRKNAIHNWPILQETREGRRAVKQMVDFIERQVIR